MAGSHPLSAAGVPGAAGVGWEEQADTSSSPTTASSPECWGCMAELNSEVQPIEQPPQGRGRLGRQLGVGDSMAAALLSTSATP